MAKLLLSTRSWFRSRRSWMLALAATLLYGLPFFVFDGFSAVDAFLKLDGIKGESKDAKYLDQIVIDSFSWGISQTGASAGGVGKVSVHDVSVTKSVDKSSPILMLRCITGEHIPEGLFSYTKPTPQGQVEFLRIKLTDILVTGYNFGTGGGGSTALPTDSLSLNFSKIEMTYLPYDAAGNAGTPVTASCDITNHTGQ
jgi:type VI secretion system secreted protein Hcp